MEPLSVCVTTFNNGRTLERCLESVRWADEIVVLDSFSTDDTPEIARRHGAVFSQHEFLGYQRQKQSAMERTAHRWVLLLDADEAVTPPLAEEIRALLRRGPDADGYRLPRRELLFWRMAAPGSRYQPFLRLFDKTKCRFSENPIHAAPRVDGKVATLRHAFEHYGMPDIATRVTKINHYSTVLVDDKRARGTSPSPWMMALYPPFYFLRQYLGKRFILSGWAGFVQAATDSFYVFLKYAKLYERAQAEKADSRRGGAGVSPPEPS